jgi:uncharacterized protein (TIGR03435 family)
MPVALRFRLAGGFSAVALAIIGQSAAASFDAASVRPASQTMGFISPIRSGDPGHRAYRNYSLRALIAEAWDLADYQVQGSAWLARDRYDVVATKPRGTSVVSERVMLQSLLRERFQLEFHKENKETPRYVLLPGKDRSKLRPEKDAQDIPGCKSFGTMPEFAHILSQILNAPVEDETGITGTFYFILAFSDSPDEATNSEAPPPPPPPPPCPGWSVDVMPSLDSNVFDAVRNQMALRLKRRGNTAVSVLVVDHVNRTPDSN